MTTDAPRSNAEQWHIPPQDGAHSSTDEAWYKMIELENERHKRQLEAYQAKQLDTQRRIGDGMALLPQQPTVIATHVVDLKAVVDWFRDELQRARDQLAVERTAASSAREALAACEAMRLEERRRAEDALEHARCDAKDAQQMLMDERAKASKPDTSADLDYRKMLSEAHERWKHQAQGYAQQIKNLEKRAKRAEDKLGKAHCERDAALDRVAELRAQLEQAKTVPPGLVPGSVEAVIEAYRLLSGKEPAWDGCEWIDDASDSRSTLIDDAERALLYWLDEHAPGGRP